MIGTVKVNRLSLHNTSSKDCEIRTMVVSEARGA